MKIRVPHSQTSRFKEFSLAFAHAIEASAGPRLRGNRLLNTIAGVAGHSGYPALLIDSKTYGEGPLDWHALPERLCTRLAALLELPSDVVLRCLKQALASSKADRLDPELTPTWEVLGPYPKLDPLRRLLVLGTNELVRCGIVSREVDPIETGHIECELAGEKAVILYYDAGYSEVRVSVWWKYEHALHPKTILFGPDYEPFSEPQPVADKKHFKDFVGVTVSGWLERRNGPYLQGRGRDFLNVYCRRGEKAALKALPAVSTFGYQPEGRFHM